MSMGWMPSDPSSKPMKMHCWYVLIIIKLKKSKEYSVGQAFEFRSLIIAAKAVANDHRPSVQAPTVNQNVGNTSGLSDVASGHMSRLPEIPLPKFGGHFHLWPTFRDSFKMQIDSRVGLSNIDKLYYLTSCLHGAALETIRGIPASYENYALAWSTLSMRFYRPLMVATALMEKVFNAASSSQESLQDLTAFVTTFQENISLVSALDIPNLGSFILFTLAFRTLPLGTRKLFESSLPSDVVYPSVDSLLKFVRSRITVLEI